MLETCASEPDDMLIGFVDCWWCARSLTGLKALFMMGEQAAALKSPTDLQQHAASPQQACSSMHMCIVNGTMCHKVASGVAVA